MEGSVRAAYEYHQKVTEIGRRWNLEQSAPSFETLVVSHFDDTLPAQAERLLEAGTSSALPEVMKKVGYAYKAFCQTAICVERSVASKEDPLSKLINKYQALTKIDAVFSERKLFSDREEKITALKEKVSALGSDFVINDDVTQLYNAIVSIQAELKAQYKDLSGRVEVFKNKYEWLKRLSDHLQSYGLELQSLAETLDKYNREFSESQDPSQIAMNEKVQAAYKALSGLEGDLATFSSELHGKCLDFKKHTAFWNSYHSILRGEKISLDDFKRIVSELVLYYRKCFLFFITNLPENIAWQQENKIYAFKVFIQSIKDKDNTANNILPEKIDEREKFLVSANRLGILSFNKVFRKIAEPELERIIAPKVPGVFCKLLDTIEGQLKEANSIPEDVFTKIQGIRDQKGDAPTDYSSAFKYLISQEEALIQILALVSPSTLADIGLPCMKDWISSVLPRDEGLTCKGEIRCDIHSALEASWIKSVYYTLIGKDKQAVEKLKGSSSFYFPDYFKKLAKLDFRLAVDLITKMEGICDEHDLRSALEVVMEKYELANQVPFQDIDKSAEKDQLLDIVCSQINPTKYEGYLGLVEQISNKQLQDKHRHNFIISDIAQGTYSKERHKMVMAQARILDDDAKKQELYSTLAITKHPGGFTFKQRMQFALEITDPKIKDGVLIKMLERKYWKKYAHLDQIFKNIADKDECSVRLLDVVVDLVDNAARYSDGRDCAKAVAGYITKSPYKELAQEKVSK